MAEAPATDENAPGSPLLPFVNPASGEGLAPPLLRRVEGDSSIRVVTLPRTEASSWHETHSELLRDPSPRVVACGGDGTTWIVSLLDANLGPGRDQPPLAVIPLGTGNDMDRVLDRGRSVTSPRVRDVTRG